MTSWLCDLLAGFWYHRPATGFLTASLGLNLALAVYPGLLSIVLESLGQPFGGHELMRLTDANTDEVDQKRIYAQLGRLTSGIKSMGERSVLQAQIAGVVLAVVCFVLLFVDWSNGLALFLPTTPLWFTLRVRHHARKRISKYERAIATYKDMCASTSARESNRKIGESIVEKLSLARE